jgi:hypothetical protein
MDSSSPKPSTFMEGAWLASRNPTAPPYDPDRGGKWLLYVDRKNVDDVWQKILTALHEGRLGPSAKVSTAVESPLSRRKNKHVICVFTVDADDEADVRRVRSELRTLGFTARLPYKTNSATRNREYASTHGRTSKYFE